MEKTNIIYEGNFAFDTDTGSIAAYIGIDNEAEIPKTVCGKAVIKIGSAFTDCRTLESATIPMPIITQKSIKH